MTDGTRAASRIPALVLEEEQNEFFLCDRTGTSRAFFFIQQNLQAVSDRCRWGTAPGACRGREEPAPSQARAHDFFFKKIMF